MIDWVFYLPPVIVLILFVYVVVHKILKRDYKGAVVTGIRTVVIGCLVIVLLFAVWFGFYFSNGGH